jgi:SP family sugar:H+ symporter-like MFS transporter
MSLECAVFIAGVIIQVTAFTSWVQVALGRLVSGVGVGGLSIIVPIVCFRPSVSSNSVSDPANLQYQAETAPPQIRGTMTCVASISLSLRFNMNR